MEDELFTLNEPARAIWDSLDGRRRLKEVVQELSAEYQAEAGEIETDVLGLVAELVRRRILVEVSAA